VGMWRILQDFFRAVTSPGGRTADAVTATSRALERAARQSGRYR
jgi:hypothetical protein